MFDADTIAAVSTPFGTGAVGVIRMSGDSAFDIANRVFHGRKKINDQKSHHSMHGVIKNPKSMETLDEVMILKMKAPATYTGEDTIEITCHGSTFVLKKVLELLYSEGARPAEPGEFTKRAFLNGKLDLAQAEAVIDLINSKTSLSHKAAYTQLEGKLSSKLKDIYKKIITLLAHIEATVEFSDEDIEQITVDGIKNQINVISNKVVKLINSFESGRIAREGIKVVIAGRPNVGKSSLLNCISGKDRAIVTEIPGTTRDTIEDYISIKGIPTTIIDTAGIRETLDPVEAIGVMKSHESINHADMVLVVLDATQEIHDDEKKLLERLKGKKHIVVINKIDLTTDSDIKSIYQSINSTISSSVIIKTSLLKNEGLDDLEKCIYDMFISEDFSFENETAITNARHKNLLDIARESLSKGLLACDAGYPLDIITIDIRDAAGNIGMITGEAVSDHVIEQIFERFCIGK